MCVIFETFFRNYVVMMMVVVCLCRQQQKKALLGFHAVRGESGAQFMCVGQYYFSLVE